MMGFTSSLICSATAKCPEKLVQRSIKICKANINDKNEKTIRRMATKIAHQHSARGVDLIIHNSSTVKSNQLIMMEMK